MNHITIDMAADFLPLAQTTGTLGYDMIRGNATYQWEFDAQWLQTPFPSAKLDPIFVNLPFHP